MAMVRPSMVKDGYVSVKGLPRIRFEAKRELPSSEALKTLRITRVGRRVTLSLGYEVEKEPLPASATAVGIDMGITDRMVLSSGQVIMAGGIPAAVPRDGRNTSSLACYIRYNSPIMRMKAGSRNESRDAHISAPLMGQSSMALVWSHKFYRSRSAWAQQSRHKKSLPASAISHAS